MISIIGLGSKAHRTSAGARRAPRSYRLAISPTAAGAQRAPHGSHIIGIIGRGPKGTTRPQPGPKGHHTALISSMSLAGAQRAPHGLSRGPKGTTRLSYHHQCCGKSPCCAAAGESLPSSVDTEAKEGRHLTDRLKNGGRSLRQHCSCHPASPCNGDRPWKNQLQIHGRWCN